MIANTHISSLYSSDVILPLTNLATHPRHVHFLGHSLPLENATGRLFIVVGSEATYTLVAARTVARPPFPLHSTSDSGLPQSHPRQVFRKRTHQEKIFSSRKFWPPKKLPHHLSSRPSSKLT